MAKKRYSSAFAVCARAGGTTAAESATVATTQPSSPANDEEKATALRRRARALRISLSDLGVSVVASRLISRLVPKVLSKQKKEIGVTVGGN